MAGVHYFQSRGYAHRDIKLENFLLDQNFSVKLCDFGLCKKMTRKDGTKKLLKTRLGTLGYSAPELRNSGEQRYDGIKIDIFSLGVTLFMLLTGHCPF